MFTAAQLVAHAVGDYLLQTDHMAAEKRRSWVVACLHGLAYSLPFLLLSPSLAAWVAIAGTHAVIDRLGLARYVVWAKNQLAPARFRYPWARAGWSGYHQVRDEDAPHLTVWLLIVADNVLHVLCNAAALRWL